jgi:hypothetical protein
MAKKIRVAKSDRIIAQQGRVLPKTVFVKWEWSGRDPFLEADEDIEALAEKGETAYVGEYKLVKTGKVSLNLMVK